MQTKHLGKTGMSVSALGFGASPLGGVFGAIDEEDGIRAVHRAVEAGVNYFDVSPFYGDTRAETVLGKGLRTLPRDQYYLATKLGRYGMDTFDFSAERVPRSIDESLQRLGTDYVDLILCHDIEFVPLSIILHETLPALRALQQTGKARFIGFSGFPLKIFPSILDHADVDVILSYCHYTLLDTSLQSLIPYLQQKQVGIINASPFTMGLLTERTLPEWHPATAAMREASAQAAAYCRSQGIELPQLALQFALANPDIATTLVGIGNTKDLETNLRWAEAPLDTALLKEVLTILEPVHNQTWASGLPENN